MARPRPSTQRGAYRLPVLAQRRWRGVAYGECRPGGKHQPPSFRGWTGEMAAELIRVDHPRMSDLRRGHLERFSLERLILFAIRLRADVTIGVRWDPQRPLAPRP